METPEIDPSTIDPPGKAKPYTFGWLWPVITNDEEAKKAARSAAYVAATVAVLTCVVSIVALITKEPFSGIDGWGILDALLFAVIAWRIFKLSFPWALSALLLYCAEMAWKWNTQGLPGGNVVVPVLVVLALIAGVRGTAFIGKRESWVAPIIVLIFITGFAIVVSQSVHQ